VNKSVDKRNQRDSDSNLQMELLLTYHFPEQHDRKIENDQPVVIAYEKVNHVHSFSFPEVLLDNGY
jgi:hypothetical protein